MLGVLIKIILIKSTLRRPRIDFFNLHPVVRVYVHTRVVDINMHMGQGHWGEYLPAH